MEGKLSSMHVCLLARNSWCLHNFIHCEGENVVNYIVACKSMFGIRKLALDHELVKQVSNWNESTLNLVGVFFLIGAVQSLVI